MAKAFFHRLSTYYESIAATLKGDALAAGAFANTTDIGTSRERAYADFLRTHLPNKCSVFQGGYLFDEAGDESKQIDLIITTDTAPRFDHLNKDGGGKSFAPVEGTLAVASIKSHLDKAQLLDALWGLASIPPTRPLDGRISTFLKLRGYEDWPFKIVYANDGLEFSTVLSHLDAFYTENPSIPISRRPDIIHVIGKYLIFRGRDGFTLDGVDMTPGKFVALTYQSDIQGLTQTLEGIHSNALASTHIMFRYDWILRGVTSHLISQFPPTSPDTVSGTK